MRTEALSPERRQAILAILGSLIAYIVVSGSNAIFGLPSAVGYVALALAFYATFAFTFHLSGLRFERPATVNVWQALALLCVTALAAWVLVFPQGPPFFRRVTAFAPGCVLAVLILGPWRGLLPASKATREKQLAKEKEGSNE